MGNNIFYEGQVLWSQIDANRHLRHSAYADFCAQARSNMLNTLGLSLDQFAKQKIGPILFREELIYKREVQLDEYIKVEILLTKLNLKNARFSFQHIIYKENGDKAAEVNVDGAWLNLVERKLTDIPAEWYEILKKIPKAESYIEINA
ncbi:acyl-CoA thioesterase [Sphingobacterium yanglingense]|uniref:Acyl-CoA thioester hydrolase n=1 Tax=Sphingobacterium yanglingense TaxID=1437280 RepID=A0A4R6WM79_9SPHI|nr:thioesterase family protein [Sphingobacterium yanglingense]TDQ79892.1 acyl-CoA thioester hydrolase [Sphingobacterium yanglingense]